MKSIITKKWNRKIYVYFVHVLLILYVTVKPLKAETQIVVCQPPKGFKIDYFIDKGAFKDKKEGVFIEDRIRMDDACAVLVWDTSKKTTLFGFVSSMGLLPSKELVPILIEPDQIMFTGVINKTVILFTIYPKENIAVYSQHLRHRGITEGIRASCLYMKCTFLNKDFFSKDMK